MDKHYFLTLAFILLLIYPSRSQDSEEVSVNFAPALANETSPPQNLYKQPRWVSWPGLAFNFNPLGFAQTGPVVQLEINLVKGLYLVPELRYNYAGYASHVLMTSLADDGNYSPSSFGAGLGIKQFFALQKKNRLIFVGLFGEYSTDKAFYNLDSPWESERIRNAVNVVGNVGYRWWFKKDFFLHIGVYGGLSFELKDESRYRMGAYKGDLEKNYKNTPFVGLIDFAFGWNL